MKTIIVIPTYTQSDRLRSCLESVVKFTDLSRVSITVVANGAPEDTRTVCNEYPVQLLWFDKPLGFPKACNVGIEHSLQTGAERIILLNDDVILLDQPRNKWIEILSEPFNNPKMGITGVLKNFCPSAQREFLLFFCVMIRREVIEELGLLDEIFTVGAGEDCDYCCKAEDAGWLVKQAPETPLYVVDKNDSSLPPHQQQMWIADFPIYHSAGETVSRIDGFQEVFARNGEILKRRYAVDISKAQRIEGWMADAELEWLARQAKKASIFVELGSWQGRSTRAIADNLPVGSVLYACDSFNGSSGEPDAHLTAKDREGDAVYMKFFENLYDHIMLGRVIPLRMESGNAAETLAKMGVKADVLFVDADHSYEGVKRDIELWKPLVRHGGVLCGHDYYLPEQNPLAWVGVRTCVDELFPDATQAPNTTIWQVKIDSPWNTLRRSIPVSDSFGKYGGFFCTENQNNSLPA